MHSATRLVCLPLLAALVWLPAPVLAEENGCTQASPCPWLFDVDADGFMGPPPEGWSFTQGDWWYVDIFNFDEEQTHTVTLDGYGLSWTIEPFEDTQSAPFQLTQAGSFVLRDQPTGDSVAVHVVAVDGDDDGAGRPTPGLGAALLLAALAGAVRLRRR